LRGEGKTVASRCTQALTIAKKRRPTIQNATPSVGHNDKDETEGEGVGNRYW